MLLKGGKRVFFLYLFILQASHTFGQSQLKHTYSLGEKGVTINKTENGFTIEYRSGDLTVEQQSRPEGDFFRAILPGHIPVSEEGKPEFPVLSRLISEPGSSTYTVKISNVVSRKIKPSRSNIRGLMYPRQPSAVKSPQRDRERFEIDRSYYSRKEYLGPDTVIIEHLGKARGLSISRIQISPIRYNPVRGDFEIITSMRIDFTEKKDQSVETGSKGTGQLGPVLSKGLLNWDESDYIPWYTENQKRMIILSDTAFKSYLKPFISWKKRMGFRIDELYKGASLAGTSYTELKDTIATIYSKGLEEDNAPAYLLIVGDIGKIPLSEGTGQISDLYYGEFDGDGDYIPELLIGRLPVSDTAELRVVLDKLMQYEMFTYPDSSAFLGRALLSAGLESSYTGHMNGQIKYIADNYLNSANGVESSVFYSPESATSEVQIYRKINQGVGLINYTGHGEVRGWIDPVLKVSQITDSLHNKNMYPFVIVNACQTGNFYTPASFGSTIIRAKDKGAAGFIGATNDSYWDEDFYWAVGLGTPGPDPKYSETGLGAFDRLMHTNGESPSDWYITMGQVNFAGNLAVMGSTTSKKKYYWEIYALLGDPSIIPWIGEPGNFSVSLPDTLPNNLKSLTLSLPPFTYLALSKNDTLIDAGYASPSGSLTLDIPGFTDDSCLFVLTGQNRRPLIKTVHFGEIQEEYLNLSAATINDTQGNNNGIADYNESFYLSLKLSNLGSAAASGLRAVISSGSDLISVVTDSAWVGNLGPKSEIVLSDKLKVKTEAFINDGSYATVDIRLTDNSVTKTYRKDISLHAPKLEILNCRVDDTSTGNGDLIADPGETFNLVFRVSNQGSSAASGQLKLLNTPAALSVNFPVVNTGFIAAGETASIPVSVTLSHAASKGTTLTINSMLDCTPYVENKVFTLPVGKTRESFEYETFSFFPWENSAAAPWIITSGQAFEGEFSARSGQIPHSAMSVLTLKINSPVVDTIRFMAKVSSEKNYDFLQVKLNGKVLFQLSGDINWTEKVIPLKEGYSTVEWIYKKDANTVSGTDCAWIDFISFPPASFSRFDLKMLKILSPAIKDIYSKETVVARIRNLGGDTIKNFSLAFAINGTTEAIEIFSNTVNPGDSIDAEFSSKANLFRNGDYRLEVFGYNSIDGFPGNDTAFIEFTNSALPAEDKVLPNPFDTEVRLQFFSEETGVADVSVTDAMGKKVFIIKEAIAEGNNELTLNLSMLGAGYYTVRVKGDATDKKFKIIKLE